MNLSLNLYGGLAVAADYFHDFVVEAWDTRYVDVTAEAMPVAMCDEQAIELNCPVFAYSAEPVTFLDVPCYGAFRDITLPDGALDTAPTAMRNQYDNWHACPSEEFGRFEDVTIGSDRTLDFYYGEGWIYYTGRRVVNGEVRYWPSGGGSMIVTEDTTPSIDDLIVHATATLYGDWNGDCVITNVELADLQNAIAGGAGTFDPLMDADCDGTLDRAELLKFLANMTNQPPCGQRGGGGDGDGSGAEGDFGGDGWTEGFAFDGSEEEGHADAAELATWIGAELTPEELAAFINDLAAATTEFADTPVAIDLMELLAHLE